MPGIHCTNMFNHSNQMILRMRQITIEKSLIKAQTLENEIIYARVDSADIYGAKFNLEG